MPAAVLTVSDALTDYGLDVSVRDITDAAEIIHQVTAFTIDDHVDVRSIPQGNVRRAQAIVAERLRRRTQGDVARSVVSETDGNYSYSVDSKAKGAHEMSLCSGVPLELLDMGRAQWYSFSERGSKLPPETDDFGVQFDTV